MPGTLRIQIGCWESLPSLRLSCLMSGRTKPVRPEWIARPRGLETGTGMDA